MNGMASSSRIPTQSRTLWFALALLFAAVTGLTMWKDWQLTGQEPNILFYLPNVP